MSGNKKRTICVDILVERFLKIPYVINTVYLVKLCGCLADFLLINLPLKKKKKKCSDIHNVSRF